MKKTETGEVAGFYTISMTSISLEQLPEATAKKIPYKLIPAGLIGRLGVDKRFQAQGVGRALLISACRRLLNANIGMFTVVVDAIDEKAIAFYEKSGFQRLPQKENNKVKLFCPARTLKKAL